MSKARAEVNQDLARERLNCPFDQEEITNLLDGSKEDTEQRRDLTKFLLERTDPSELEIQIESLGAEERYEHDLRKAMKLFKLAQEYCGGTASVDTLREVLGGGGGSFLLPDGNPFSLHFAMFLPTIMGQGTLEQQVRWLDAAWNLEIVGTYAQTELGHGTFIRGLETTATYDPKAEEFVLHSPSLSAFKWWPGGLGKTADHAVVMAQLVTPDGAKRGPHAFMVQLRDRKTHKCLPGIRLGEIGPKLGMNSYDNGFLGFERHRIPRENMLMKNAQVLPDGSYLRPARAQLSYGTMVFVRCAIAMDCARMLRKAVAIAVRYSAVRRQSELIPDRGETQVFDYLTQQLKLLPPLSLCFSLTLAAQRLWKDYEENIQRQEDGDLKGLPDLHALSCGLKALVTSEAASSIDLVRRSCGGHGFMASSNLPRLWGLVTAACTYEGENTVMWLQVARHLAKTTPPTSSLNTDWNRRNQFGPLFQQVANGKLAHAQDKLKREEHIGKGQSSRPQDDISALAWNAASAALVQAAEAHVKTFVVKEFERRIADEEGVLSAPVRKVLGQLCRMNALSWILDGGVGDFVVYGGLGSPDLEGLEAERESLLRELRPVAVSLVDAFDFEDASLMSTLGSWDGRAYERLFSSALKTPLNRADVQKAVFKYVKCPTAKASL